jgi:hypothetical protein
MRSLGFGLVAIALAAYSDAAQRTDAEPARQDDTPAVDTLAGATSDDATTPSDARSRYTSLEDCNVVASGGEDASYSLQHCEGIGAVLVRTTADARDDLAILMDDGARFDLDLNRVARGAFSAIGATAEWRYAADAAPADPPTALIFRFGIFENPETPDRPVSYLVVVRLAAEFACVIGVVPPGVRQNESARLIANRASS